MGEMTLGNSCFEEEVVGVAVDRGGGFWARGEVGAWCG